MSEREAADAVATITDAPIDPESHVEPGPAYRGRRRASSWHDERVARGWSLRQLEERAGINRGEISRIERGRACVGPDQARRLLAAFDEASS